MVDCVAHYLAQFAELEGRADALGWGWTHPFRRSAMARFAELGFPTTRHEEWKYTNLGPFTEIPFMPASLEPGRDVSPEALKRVPFWDLPGCRLVFVNGAFAPELSRLSDLPSRVTVGSLKAAAATSRVQVEPCLAAIQDQPFAALNTAFMEDGAFVHLPRGTLLPQPIYLLFLTAAGNPEMWHPRNVIVLERGSQASVVELYASLREGISFTNTVTSIVLEEDAVLDHYKVELESERSFHIALMQARQSRSSTFSSHSIVLGGGMVRNDVRVDLEGKGGDVTLNGLYVLSGRQHVDNRTWIDHVAPHCTSRELYKGVLDEQSRGVFNGRIVVRKNAQKTDARQTNKNLLLSEEAVVDTKPQLEIHADDVKCSHGSTIGQLDTDAVFYLRSRGMGLNQARHLLTHAFAGEVVARMKLGPVRLALDELVMSRLRPCHEAVLA